MRVPRDTLTVCLVFALGLAALALDRDQPLVRNSLVYARAAEHVIAHGFDPRPVVADSRLCYDKPIGFAWSSAPLVAAFGNHLGLMLASALGVLALLAATQQLLRTVLPGLAHERLRARALWFGSLSPLLVYQTWSAHPDAIEAALQIAAVTQVWRLTEAPSSAPVRRAALHFATVESGVLFKNYGLVLLIMLPVAFAPRLLHCWRSGGRTAVMGLMTAWSGTAALALLAAFDRNPLHRLAGEGGGVGQYGRGALLASAGGCALALLLALALCVQVALPFVARCRPGAHRLWPLLVCSAVYFAGLLPFPNAYYNLRYFLPVLPIVGLLGACGLESCGARTARIVVCVFTAVALAATALWNVPDLSARAQAWLPEWRLRGAAMPGMLDNLRMPQHREAREWLRRLDAAAPPNAVVYLVDFNYYGDAQHGVYERGGRIRADVGTRYVARRRLRPSEAEFLVCFARQPDAAGLARFGTVSEPQPGFFLVRRP